MSNGDPEHLRALADALLRVANQMDGGKSKIISGIGPARAKSLVGVVPIEIPSSTIETQTPSDWLSGKDEAEVGKDDTLSSLTQAKKKGKKLKGKKRRTATGPGRKAGISSEASGAKLPLYVGDPKGEALPMDTVRNLIPKVYEALYMTNLMKKNVFMVDIAEDDRAAHATLLEVKDDQPMMNTLKLNLDLCQINHRFMAFQAFKCP